MSENLLNNVKYDNKKYFSDNVPQLLRKDYPIYLIQAPKNCGKTKYMFGNDALSIVNSGKKFVLLRNSDEQARNFGIDTYIPNSKILKNGQIMRIINDEWTQIGIACGVSTLYKLRSRESFDNYSRVYYDEFNENTFKPTDKYYDNFCIALDDIQRNNKDLKVFIVGNKHLAEHELLVRWGIYFDNENKLQEILVNDKKDNTPLVQALFLPLSEIPNKTITIGSRLARFKNTSNAFFHNSTFLSKRSLKIWNYEEAIQPFFNISVVNGFCSYDTIDDETKYYLILKCVNKEQKDVIVYMIKLKDDYDNLIYDNYKALDIKARSGETINFDKDDILDLLNLIETYKENNKLIFDSQATSIKVNNLLSMLSLNDI